MPTHYLGFDFGLKRTGVAIGQSVTGTAQALATLTGKQPDWPGIEALIATWQPRALIVGMPYQSDGGPQAMTQRAEKFIRQLQGRFHLPVHAVDERYSSIEAEATLKADKALGFRKKIAKEMIASMAAQLILQSWLDQQEFDADEQ